MKKQKRFLLLSLLTLALSGCSVSDIVNKFSLKKDSSNEDIFVTGIELDKTSFSLRVGEHEQLNAVVSPENATNKNVIYSTADSNVASVSETGYVTAISVGETIITAKTEDHGFEASCSITVFDDSPIDVVVNNLSSSFVTISSDKTTAKPGDDVTLTIIAKGDGYKVDTVSASDSKSNSIQLTKSNNKYSFKLPDDGVINVTSTVKGVDIKVFVTDEYGLITGNPSMSLDGGVNYTSLQIAGNYQGFDYYLVEYGSYVKFSLAQSGDYIPTGLKVDDSTFSINEGVVTFRVTLDDLQYDFINVVPTFKYDGAPEGDYEIEVRNSTHLTASVYWSVEDTHAATSIDVDVQAIIRIESTDERYECREIEIKYFNTTETTSASTIKATFVEDEEDSYWTFKVPYTPAKKIIITVYEADNSLLKDLDLGGTYLTFKVSPAVYKISTFENEIVTLTNSGSLKIMKNTVVSNYDTIDSYDETSLKTISHQSYVYGKDVFMFSTDSSSTGLISSSFGTYNTFCVKKEKATDSNDDYSIDAERFIIDGNSYVTFNIYHNSKLINSGYAEMTAKHAYFNTDIELISGQSISADKVVYSVSKDSTIVKVIGYNGVGGNSNRCILGDYFGYYGANNELFIFGSLSAIYEETTFNYSIEGNTITLTTADREVVLTLDNSSRTYDVVTDKTLTVTLPEFAGKAFKNDYAFEDNYFYFGFYIEFSDVAQTLSCVGAANYNISMNNCSTQQFAYNVDAPYTYDEATKTISVYLQVKDKSTKLVTMTYAPGSPNKIQLPSKVIGSNQLYDTTANLSEI